MSPVTPHISRLLIYPIKSLDPVLVDQATLLTSGALQYDREFALVDQLGNFVNAKRYSKVQLLRSQFNLEQQVVSLSKADSEQIYSFHLEEDRVTLEAWLSAYFGFPVQLQRNREMGFPDDTASPGPTFISTATLETVAHWYPQLTVEEIRWRFRSNIEISGVPAFWEDHLFAAPDRTVEFQVGSVKFLGVNPCQRCIVPTRDTQTAAPTPNFQQIFAAKRQATLPDWADRSRFNHFYRLAVNTRSLSSEAGKTIQIGDEIRIEA